MKERSNGAISRLDPGRRDRSEIPGQTGRYPFFKPITEIGYHALGGKHPHLPGFALVTNGGRADARLAIDANGELYIDTKSDGMIRAVVGVSGF